MKDCNDVLLATDDDREGEAIAWHICNVLDLPVNTTKRIIFHEVTKPALLKAVQSTTIINMDIVSSADAFDSIISKLQTYFSGQELLSVSSFKELSMLSRKNAIPMLEYLDINGYTIRNGADRKKGPYFFEQ